MARLTGLASFASILLGVLLVLRAVHVVVPMVYAPSDPRPFHTNDPGRAAERAGFAPWIPFYLPESLGTRSQLTVLRRPRPRISLAWIGERTLSLREEPSTELGLLPPTARPLPGSRGDVYWNGPEMLHAVALRENVRIVIATDLSLRDLGRVAATLRRSGRGAPASAGSPLEITDPPAE